ncbi:MAG: DUF692 domain-containing protein [Gammaproteobacteria bacterium]|nr:DUF692 domain-containing protein [Gammaproteobacteria bacterium]
MTQSLRGVGVGLRVEHFNELLESASNPVPWLEILADNFLSAGGPSIRNLERVAQRYPLSFHCVGMSLGSTDPINKAYFKRLKEQVDRFQPALISDHLAWVSVHHRYLHDLIPLPYTQESLAHMVSRVQHAQELLGRTIIIENPSAYLSFKESEISETEFLRQLHQQTDCGLLIDVNNIYVSAVNNDFSAHDYLNDLPASAVAELHLAGYEEQAGYLFDSHGQRVHQPVWDLYQQALQRFGDTPTLIEWDTDIPPFSVLAEEVAKAQAYQQQCQEVEA